MIRLCKNLQIVIKAQRNLIQNWRSGKLVRADDTWHFMIFMLTITFYLIFFCNPLKNIYWAQAIFQILYYIREWGKEFPSLPNNVRNRIHLQVVYNLIYWKMDGCMIGWVDWIRWWLCRYKRYFTIQKVDKCEVNSLKKCVWNFLKVGW